MKEDNKLKINFDWSTVSFNLADTRYIKMFVLDEADEMLSRGFKDQIYDVFKNLNENIQVSIVMRTFG